MEWKLMWKKTKLLRLSRQISAVQMIDQKEPGNVEYFKYLGSVVRNDGRCTREIKSRIAVAKAAFKTKKTFQQQIRLKFKEETIKVLHSDHSFIWC
jgi:chorismate mutase